MPRRLARGAAAAVLLALSLSACGGEPNEPDPSTQEDTMYCDLIDPETIQPLVGGGEVKDFGEPVAKSDTRTIKCNLYDEERREDVLAVYEYEVASAKLQGERDQATAAMTRYAAEDPDHYVALEGDDLGYAWFTGDTAAANLLTDSRKISVTIPATAEQAAEFTPLALKVAQEIDTNLDAWDADNPS